MSRCGHRSKGKTAADFDKRQLEDGIKVEMEHTCSRSKAERVAMYHLMESPDYYKALKKMEAELDKQAERKRKGKKR